MNSLTHFLKPYRKQSVLGPLFKMVEALFELLVPLVVAAIIDRGIGGGDGALVWRMGLILVGLGVVGLASSLTAQYFAAVAAVGFARQVTRALLNHIQRLSYTQLDRLGAASLITRMTSDVNQVQTGVNLTIRLFLRSPFIVFGSMIMAFTIDARAATVFAVVIPVLALIVFGIMLITIPLYKRVQTRLTGVLRITRENLTGVRVLRAFHREAAEQASFGERNEQLYASQRAAQRISALMNPLTYLVLNLALIALIWTGALRVDGGVITQGAVVALVNYLMQILVELIKLANLIITMTRAAASWGRVRAVLDAPSGEQSGEKAPSGEARAAISFENVSVRYAGAGAPSLTGITFDVQRGACVGVIGGTGSGKSTLVNLIPRFYDAQEGSVKVDGVDVREWDLTALRARIGVVPQFATLFEGTIKDNLRFGNPDATDEQLIRALETAQALAFVQERAGGLNAPINQRGKNLSGGQRQRLTIARALVREPEILILDDSASALDYRTDARLRQALTSLPNAPTLVIVSQRAASIMHADLIVVLDDGRMAGLGTHEELLKNCAVYREIFNSQFPADKEAM